MSRRHGKRKQPLFESNRPFAVECPTCRSHLAVAREIVGRVAGCPACHGVFVVPPAEFTDPESSASRHRDRRPALPAAADREPTAAPADTPTRSDPRSNPAPPASAPAGTSGPARVRPEHHAPSALTPTPTTAPPPAATPTPAATTASAVATTRTTDEPLVFSEPPPPSTRRRPLESAAWNADQPALQPTPVAADRGQPDPVVAAPAADRPTAAAPAGDDATGLTFREPVKTVRTGSAEIELRQLSPEEKRTRRARRNILILVVGAALLVALVVVLGQGKR